jgi:hypothetical protein
MFTKVDVFLAIMMLPEKRWCPRCREFFVADCFTPHKKCFARMIAEEKGDIYGKSSDKNSFNK